MTQATETEHETCYGVHPESGERCILEWHRGHHESADGARWLDD